MAAFTAVAAGVGLAVTAATTAASFAQAAEQNEKKRKAEESAAAAMMEARKKLDVNYYEQLSIQKEPYELARRELLSQGALATQQLAEGDPRALAAGVGRVQLAQQLGQEKVATAMQQEKSTLDKLVAGEESRLRDLGTQLDLQEVVGAQQAMSDAITAESMAIQQGMAGVTSLGGQVAGMAQLYEKTPSQRAVNKANRQLGGAVEGSVIDAFGAAEGAGMMPQMNAKQLEMLKGYKVDSFQKLTPDAQNAFILEYDPQTIDQYSKLYGGLRGANLGLGGAGSNPFMGIF
jgi:hypothetical protein